MLNYSKKLLDVVMDTPAHFQGVVDLLEDLQVHIVVSGPSPTMRLVTVRTSEGVGFVVHATNKLFSKAVKYQPIEFNRDNSKYYEDFYSLNPTQEIIRIFEALVECEDLMELINTSPAANLKRKDIVFAGTGELYLWKQIDYWTLLSWKLDSGYNEQAVGRFLEFHTGVVGTSDSALGTVSDVKPFELLMDMPFSTFYKKEDQGSESNLMRGSSAFSG